MLLPLSWGFVVRGAARREVIQSEHWPMRSLTGLVLRRNLIRKYPMHIQCSYAVSWCHVKCLSFGNPVGGSLGRPRPTMLLRQYTQFSFEGIPSFLTQVSKYNTSMDYGPHLTTVWACTRLFLKVQNLA